MTFAAITVFFILYVPLSGLMQGVAPAGCVSTWHPEIVVPSVAASMVALAVGLLPPFWNRPRYNGDGEEEEGRRPRKRVARRRPGDG